jgi:rod shape-determining protein MreD
MRLFVYVTIVLLLVPLQASLLAPLSRIGLAPDLGSAVVSVIGLLTGPFEGAAAGIAFGLLQDTGSASMLGLSGLALGIAGLLAGLLGQQVLDVEGPCTMIFFAAFCFIGSLLSVLVLDLTYGEFPLLRLSVFRLAPQAAVTAVAGYAILRFAQRRTVAPVVRRRELQKEH